MLILWPGSRPGFGSRSGDGLFDRQNEVCGMRGGDNAVTRLRGDQQGVSAGWGRQVVGRPVIEVVVARSTRGHAEDHHETYQCNQRKTRSEEHTSELQSLRHLVCRLLLANN